MVQKRQSLVTETNRHREQSHQQGMYLRMRNRYDFDFKILYINSKFILFQKTETITINTTRPIAKIGVPSKSVLVPEISSYKPNLPVPGLAQLRQRPATTNLAIPPSRRSPPKVRLRTETNV